MFQDPTCTDSAPRDVAGALALALALALAAPRGGAGAPGVEPSGRAGGGGGIEPSGRAAGGGGTFGGGMAVEKKAARCYCCCLRKQGFKDNSYVHTHKPIPNM